MRKKGRKILVGCVSFPADRGGRVAKFKTHSGGAGDLSGFSRHSKVYLTCSGLISGLRKQ